MCSTPRSASCWPSPPSFLPRRLCARAGRRAAEPRPPRLPRRAGGAAGQAGHTTWRLEQEPAVGMLWTYADRNADGSYRRIGGGPYDAATDTYGAGRVQRRRHLARGRRLPPLLAPPPRRPQPPRGLRAAARAHLHADRVGAERRQRRPVDAARRHASTRARSRWSCPTRPTARSPTGWRAPCGRSARATASSRTSIRPSRASCASASISSIAALDRQVLVALRRRRRWSTAARFRRG